MQKPYFNLIDEPWIPCIPLQGDGTPQLFSLRETLTRAHELCEIYSDSPLTIAALHRLLLAILHDVFGPKDTEAWKELWQGVA
jgi:CRISPR system Cascade subunit CasA